MSKTIEQVAGIDAAFLHLETAEMPMHVGALQLLALPAAYDGDFVLDLRAHMAARLPLAPVLRRRLESVPLNLANPSWIDAEPDLDLHIVAHQLPPGSGLAELERQVGRLHPQLLDRSLPLWKFHVFLGLQPGPDGEQQLGLYSQLHHAAVDGQAAVALAELMLDLGPQPQARSLPAKRKRLVKLGATGLLRGALTQQWRQTVKLARALPAAAGTLSLMAARAAVDAAGGSLRQWLSTDPDATSERVSNLGLAPRTRLNTSLSAERSFATVSLPLAALNQARRLHGASLNDALLFICGGALRRLFARQGPLPAKSLVAAVPVSTRAGGAATANTANTQVTMSLVNLGTHLADPAKRLAHVLAASAAMKGELAHLKDLMPSDYPSLGVPWLMQAGALLYGRLHAADKLPVLANLVISNVPGPSVPLYLAGARVLSNYPASIVVHGLALNITVQSFDAALDIGVMACGRALPETAVLAAYIETAFMEFLALPAAAGPKPRVARKRAAGTR